MSELTCAEARDLASDLIDGELEPEQAEMVRAHVDRCASCPTLYRALVAVVAALRGSGGRQSHTET